MGRSWRRGPRWREVMGRALGKRPRPPSRARAPDTAQMTMSLRERPAQQLQQRQGARIDGLRPSWLGTSWSTGDAAACEGPRAGAPVAMGVPPPPVATAVAVHERVNLCGALDCPSTPDAGLGRAFHLLDPFAPSPCVYSKRTRGDDHTSPRGSEAPIHLPFCPQAPPAPAAAQRSPQPTPQPTPRSPRRAAHATAYEGPCAALPVGAPLLLPPARLRTCLPPAHQWPLPTSMPLPMLASEASTLTLVRA